MPDRSRQRLVPGCARTLGEIADWPMLSAGEKEALLRALAERQPDRIT